MKTDLSKILAISGQSGLYLYISHSRTGVIVESLSDKKRSFDTMSVIVPEELGLCKIMKLPVEDLQNFIEKGMN
jgi:3-dehydroquinate synthetase